MFKYANIILMKQRYAELFDYLSAPELPEHATGTIVFGRKDPLVAEAYVDLSEQGLVDWGVMTGGVGKDSGDLKIPEAEYLARQADMMAELRRVDLPMTIVETQATNGGENVRNSMEVMRRAKLGYNAITAVAHATSLRRLAAMVDHESSQTDTPIKLVYRKPSAYDFDISNPTDQQEAVAEMNRLADWPAKNWLRPGSEHDLPQDLVDFAKDISK